MVAPFVQHGFGTLGSICLDRRIESFWSLLQGADTDQLGSYTILF